jgi:Collagen triple helix repeat (20 copies).
MTFKMKGLAAAMMCASVLLAGCEGDDGAPGATGPAGATGATGPAGATGLRCAPGPDGQDATRTAISLSFLGRGVNTDAAFDGSGGRYRRFRAHKRPRLL